MTKLKYVQTVRMNGTEYYVGRYTHKGKRYHLTGFKTPEEAHHAAIEAKQRMELADAKPVRKPRPPTSDLVEYQGVAKTRLGWAEFFRIDPSTLWRQAKAHNRTVKEEILHRLQGRDLGASQM